MLTTILQQLGLNETEIKVYLALLPLGTVPASVVAIRLGMPRSTAKYTCQQLVDWGLVTKTNKNHTFLFAAKDPESLYNILEKQKQEISQKEGEVSKILTELKKIYNPHTIIPKIRFFEGPENINKMLQDVLDDAKPLYGALNMEVDFPPLIASYIWNTYIPERKRMFFPSWMLFNDNDLTRDYRKEDLDMNRISLLVPEKDFPFKICFHIYGDKVAFYSYEPTDLVGVIIEDSFIRDMQFSLFKLAWNYSRLLPANENYRKVELEDR